MVWMFLLGGCASCLQLPDEGPDAPPESGVDSGNLPADTGGEDTAEDTGPVVIPRCQLEEVEDANPADDFSQMLYVPLSTYACGDVNTKGDVDYLTFTTVTPGWMKVEVQAASRGSSADMFYTLTQPERDQVVVQADGYLTSDPANVFYAESPGDYIAALSESHGDFGAAYPWWFLAMSTKEPYSYHLVDGEVVDDATLDALAITPDREAESTNDEPEGAQELVENQPVLGQIATRGDYDWYVFHLPEGATHVIEEVDAADLGSAADMHLTRYWGGTERFLLMEDGNDGRTDGPDPWEDVDLAYEREKTAEIIAGNPAAYPGTVDTSTIYIRARNWNEDRGSMFFWYTLRVHSTTEEK